jgi:hypothetical protein
VHCKTIDLRAGQKGQKTIDLRAGQKVKKKERKAKVHKSFPFIFGTIVGLQTREQSP